MITACIKIRKNETLEGFTQRGALRLAAGSLSVPSIESRLQVRSSIKKDVLVRDLIFSRATFADLVGDPEQTEHGMETEIHVKAGRGL